MPPKLLNEVWIKLSRGYSKGHERGLYRSILTSHGVHVEWIYNVTATSNALARPSSCISLSLEFFISKTTPKTAPRLSVSTRASECPAPSIFFPKRQRTSILLLRARTLRLQTTALRTSQRAKTRQRPMEMTIFTCTGSSWEGAADIAPILIGEQRCLASTAIPTVPGSSHHFKSSESIHTLAASCPRACSGGRQAQSGLAREISWGNGW